MKVSRKVGRRKHSRRSSISRRRFRSKKSRSGYKKRYAKTQKGGKRGRGQKRIGARTHKRGKRFHRGGEPINCTLFTENNGIYELTIPTNQQLYVKKNREPFQGKPTQEFNVTLSVKTGRKFIEDMSTSTSQSSTPTQFVVTFERTTTGKDGKSVSFSISDLSYFTDTDKQRETNRVRNNNETYDFSNSDNQAFFIAIQACIQDQLLKQKQELKAYYDEVKDLLEQCKIVILSSMEPLRDDMVTSTDLKSIVSSFEASSTRGQKPFFSFFLFVYFNTQTGVIEPEKTTKLLKLFKSLDKYGIFSCISVVSFNELKKLSKIIKTKVQELITTCSSLIDIFTKESTEFTTATDNMRKYNTSLSSLTPSTQQCPTGKVTDLGIKVVGLVRVTEEGTNNTEFLDYDDVPPDTLSTYVATLPPLDFNPEDYKPKLEKPSDIEIKKQKIETRRGEVDGVIASLGENITAHENDTTSMVISYSEFKAQQESQATRLKEQIDELTGISDDEKKTRKANVDFYLQKILKTQFDFMQKKFRAFYIYQDFPKPENALVSYDNSTSGLDDKDKDYSNYKVTDILKILAENVKAFQFRMEKQAENQVSDEYSDLVSTSTSDSNYEKLFAGCKIFSKDSKGNLIGNATACCKSLEYTPSMPRESF